MRLNIKSIVAKNWMFLGLILVAIFLRLFRLSEFTMFLSDQGRDAIIMKRIVTFMHFPAIGAPSSIGQVYLGPFYYYLIAPFLLLFNFNPVGMSFGSVFLSILGIIFAYIVVKKEINKPVALIFAFFLTFSSINIEMSRFSWNPNLLPYFSFFTLYFFFRLSQLNTRILAIIFGLFFGLSIQLHYLAVLLILPILTYFIKTMLTTNKKSKYLFNIALSIISFVLVSSPLIIFDLRHDFINSANFIKLFTEGNVVGQSSFLSRLTDVCQNAFNYILSTQNNAYLAIFCGLTMIFWIFTIKKKTSCFLILNFINIVWFFLAFSMLNSPRLNHYYGQVYLSMFLVIGYLFYSLKETLPKYWKMFVLLFLLGFLAINFQRYYFLFEKSTNQIDHSRKVADFIALKINKQPFNIATWPVELTEDNYLYFLELKGLVPADRTKIQITDQMFVLCNNKPCRIFDSPSWNISMFGPAKIDKIWEIEGITVYRLIHNR